MKQFNSIFQSARLKLTVWYLLIIMVISLSFSAVIYKSVTFEFRRRLGMIERRLRLGEREIRPLIGPRPFFLEDLEASREKVLFILLYANGAILLFSGVAGYFLAGRTLRPIEKAMEEQKRFVADASHELRTPLAALKTSIEVALRDKKMSLEEAKKVMKSSLEDINGLQSLSDDLLSLASYQKGNNNFTFKTVEIKKIIESASKKIKPLAKKKNIKVAVGTKGQALQGNEKSLEEMMLIFLDNAVKYTPDGGKVSVTTKSDKKNFIIKVKDTGIGIAKEDIPHIFDRFYRVDQSRSKENVLGYGLGLSLAKKIIEIHKGSVNVFSTLGKGTTFTIKLPLKYS